jgi:flagellar export protein FliJ
MKQFRFRLDTVLNVRRHELDLKRADLSRAQAEARRLAQWLVELGERAQQGAAQLYTRAQVGMPAGEFAAGYRGATALHQAIGDARIEEATAREEVDRTLQGVLEARARVRTLEKLRERAQLEHSRHASRIEQAEFDEIAARTVGASARC